MTRRWYWIAGGMLVATPFLFGGVLFALALMWPWPQVERVIDDYGVGLALVLTWSPLVASVPWVCWLCPWLASRDKATKPPEHPMAYGRSLQLFVWVPIGGLVVSIGLLSAIGLVLRARDRATADLAAANHILWTAGLAALLFVLLLPWTWWLSRRVKWRFRATLAARAVCRRCGYDLRGNPAATGCPECGEGITDRTGDGESGGAGV